jgi:hypothetical protein
MNWINRRFRNRLATVVLGAPALATVSLLMVESLGGRPRPTHAVPRTAAPKRPLVGDTQVISQSTSVRYASQVGCKADGATDCTAAVQAVLDTAGVAGTPVRFVFDSAGVYLIAGSIKLWSNQELDGLGVATIKKGGTGVGDSKPIVTNKHWVAYSTGSQTDQYVTIRNLYVDGNRRGGASNNPNNPTMTANSPQGYVVPTLGFYGINIFHIENVHVYDSPAYGMQLGFATNGVIINFSKYLAAGDTVPGDAVIQCQGGCSDLWMYGLHGTTNDDHVAFNANDGNDIPGNIATFWPGSVHYGPISNCVVSDSVFTPGALNVGNMGRCLSANPSGAPITNITWRNCTATVQDRGVIFNDFTISPGLGWYDGITLDNCTFYATGNLNDGVVWASSATMGRLTIRNCRVIPSATQSNGPLIWLLSGSTVGSLLVDGFDLYDPSAYVTKPIVGLFGTLTDGELKSLRWNRGTASTLSQPAISSTGTVGRIRVIGGAFDRISNVVNVSGGSPVVVAAGVTHTNAGGGKSFTSSGSGTLTSSSLITSAIDSASVGP